MISPQGCQVPNDRNNKTANWYRCDRARPPFFGCCGSNPCATAHGCPKSDLAAAVLSDDVLRARVFTAFTSSTQVNITADEGVRPEETSAPDHVTSQNVASTDGKHPVHLGLKIAIPLISFFLLSIGLYFFHRGRKRHRGSQNKPDTMMRVAEMGDARRRFSMASSTFVRPRPAPPPPISSPPPLGILPFSARQKPKLSLLNPNRR
ncbi:hypothetical protein SAMD00023353_0501040 [Rosellinia necatrix]|uniref:Uncharacterized protein n=1 Tax=Rosellinia necatrix TaxID=77044 RepID=A0A1S7UKC6_ROSNE|nr:hypothetical protein SAMD00023353_0501040 [Rosellinia necatrix]